MSLLTCMTSHPPLASTAAMPAETAQTCSGLLSVVPTRRGVCSWKRHGFILARLAFADKLLFDHAWMSIRTEPSDQPAFLFFGPFTVQGDEAFQDHFDGQAMRPAVGIETRSVNISERFSSGGCLGRSGAHTSRRGHQSPRRRCARQLAFPRPLDRLRSPCRRGGQRARDRIGLGRGVSDWADDDMDRDRAFPPKCA